MAGSRWGGRVVVQIGATTQRELHAELAVLPSRARAERLRQLALVGLSCLRRPVGTAAEPVGAPPPADRLAPRRERLLQALGADW
jgi:hypothetical protein